MLTILILLGKKNSIGNHLSDVYQLLWLLHPKILYKNNWVMICLSPTLFMTLWVFFPNSVQALVHVPSHPCIRGYPSCYLHSCALSHSLMQFHGLVFSCLVHFYTCLSEPAQNANRASFVLETIAVILFTCS